MAIIDGTNGGEGEGACHLECVAQGPRAVYTEASQSAVADALATGRASAWPIPALWDGGAGARIAEIVARFLTGPDAPTG